MTTHATNNTEEATMEARAQARFVRVTPMKARRVDKDFWISFIF